MPIPPPTESTLKEVRPPKPKVYAISSVLDYIRAMRTATSIGPSEAREFANLEEEFEARYADAQNEP